MFQGWEYPEDMGMGRWDLFSCINVEIVHVACTRIHAEAAILPLFVEYFPWPVLRDDGRTRGRKKTFELGSPRYYYC